MTTRLWLTGAWLLSMAVPAVLLPCSARAETPAEQRIRRLEETLRRTQEELEALKNEVKQQRAIGQASQKQVEQATEAAEAAKTASAETAKKTVSLPDWISRTSVFGDVRFRHEGFYHQPHLVGADTTARNRERIARASASASPSATSCRPPFAAPAATSTTRSPPTRT